VPSWGLSAIHTAVMGMAAPRTKLGALVVTVARRLVPNCSAAVVTNNTQ